MHPFEICKTVARDIRRHWQFQIFLVLPTASMMAALPYVMHAIFRGVGSHSALVLASEIVVSGLSVISCAALVSVTWHRLILLQNDTSNASFLQIARLVFAYVVTSLGIGLAVSFASLPIAIALAVLTHLQPALFFAGNLTVDFLVAFLSAIWAQYISLHLSPMLPACAIGASASWTDILSRGRPYRVSLLLIAIIFASAVTPGSVALPFSVGQTGTGIEFPGLPLFLVQVLKEWGYLSLQTAVATALYQNIMADRPQVPA